MWSPPVKAEVPRRAVRDVLLAGVPTLIHPRALLALSALVFAAPRFASADVPTTPSARLELTRGAGTSGCPTDDEIRNAVSGRLGYDPFRLDAQRLVSATIAREGRGLTVTIAVRDAAGRAAGSRQLSSAQNDCAELASAMTLAISIAIDPLAFTRAAPPPSAPPPAPPAPVSPPPQVDAPPPAAPVPDAHPPAPTAQSAPPVPPPPPTPAVSETEAAPVDAVTLRASLGTIASIGAAPGVGFGVTGQIGVRWRALSIGIEGRDDLPVSADTQGSSGVRTALLLASIVPCVHHRFLAGCALGSAGVMQGTGFGVDRPLSQTTPYAAAGARVAAEFAADRLLVLQIHVDLLTTLTPTTLLLNGATAWVTPPASGALGVALVGNFL
jgi:hypothetical protein